MAVPANNLRWITSTQAAEILQVTPFTLRTYCNEGLLNHVREGRATKKRYLILENDLYEFKRRKEMNEKCNITVEQFAELLRADKKQAYLFVCGMLREMLSTVSQEQVETFVRGAVFLISAAEDKTGIEVKQILLDSLIKAEQHICALDLSEANPS